MEKMERRENIRIATDVPAVVELPDGSCSNCKITDYSVGGYFIQPDQTDMSKDASYALLARSIGDIILVNTFGLLTQVRIVRKTDFGLGTTTCLSC